MMQTTNAAGVTITDKCCLIMDEVDGMSAGDRGGIGALVSLIKKTKVQTISTSVSVNVTQIALDSNHLHRK